MEVFYTPPEIPVTPLAFFVTPPDGFVTRLEDSVISQNCFYTPPEVSGTAPRGFFTTKGKTSQKSNKN